jgi:hypothetical protein
MNANQCDWSWSGRISQALGVSVLALALGTAGASAQLVNGNFLPGNASNAPTAAWSELGVDHGGLTPQLPGWSVSGSGIDCLMLSSAPTTSTQMCGSSYGATLTQTPGAVPGGYTGDIVVADAFSTYAEAITQTITGLAKNTAYSLSFYYSGAQQAGFSGSSSDYWQVSYGPSSGTNTVSTPAICIPQPVSGTLCTGDASSSAPVWAKETINFVTNSAGTQFISFLAQGNAPANEPPFMLLANINVSAVPEPTSLMLLGAGVIGLVASKRRKRAAEA